MEDVVTPNIPIPGIGAAGVWADSLVGAVLCVHGIHHTTNWHSAVTALAHPGTGPAFSGPLTSFLPWNFQLVPGMDSLALAVETVERVMAFGADGFYAP